MIESKKLGDFPAYEAAEAKVRQLKATEANLRSAIRENENRLNRDRAQVRTEALQTLGAGGDYQNALRSRQQIADELARQREECVVVQRAIQEAEQTVSSARGEASRQICEAVKPQHDAALREMALGIISANKVALTATRIREQLASDDVSTSYLPLVVFPGIGQGTLDPCSRLAYFVRECLRQGLLDRKEVPPAWRQHWGI